MQAVVSRQIAQRRSANAAAVRTKRCVLQGFCKRGGQPSLSAQSRRACRRRVRFGRRKRSFGKRRRFCLWTSPPAKVRKERLSQKDKSGAAGQERLRQGPAQTAAGRNGAFFAAGGAQGPAACLILFTRKVRAGRLILLGPSYAQSKKTPDGAAAPQDGKPPAKTRRAEAAACRGPLRRDAHAGRRKPPRREGFPSRSTRPRVGQEKRTFSAPLRLVKEGAFSKPLRGHGFARLLRKAERKGDKARADRLGGRKRVPPNAHAGEGPRRRASRRAENLRRYLRLAGGPLVLQQLQRTFFVLVFLYFDSDCTQSPAHRAAEKTGRTIFS